MTARQLIDILRKRYNDATLKDSKAQSPVQVCVCDVTRAWVERFWWDFAEDTALYGRLMEFVECIRKVSDKAANELKSVITRKVGVRFYINVRRGARCWH